MNVLPDIHRRNALRASAAACAATAIPVGSTAAEFAQFIDVEQQRWKPVIVRAKVKPD